MNIDHLHPLSVHFPIALILVGFLFDFLSLIFKKEQWLSKAGLYLMVLGTLGAVAAVLTGEFFSKELTGFAGEKKEFHEIIAKTAMYIMIAASVLRIIPLLMKKEIAWLKWTVFVLFLAGCVFVGYAGLLGGQLVYDIML
jgi:uncharacterized membrane protein